MAKAGITSMAIPAHVGLIPDGLRRWARTHKVSFRKSYLLGINKFVDFGIWLKGYGVKTLTAWALSTDNIRGRDKSEIDMLLNLYAASARDPKIINKLKRNQTKVNIIGRLELLPKDARRALLELQEKTKQYKDFSINLLVAYGGTDDLIYAAERLAKGKKRPKLINESVLRSFLMTRKVTNPGLIIRTSGEQRLSGFLPFQSCYSELYFANKYWPDFDKRDLKRAMTDFARRKRRYGR